MKTIFNPYVMKKAGQKAAWVAKHGTRDQKSGRFLPPANWKGDLAPSPAATKSSPKRA